ncbi:MAG: phenylalanine--tRNA ligase subunit beta [Cytophagales bacterium]|nr:phenylalanine--tRNA ligase subunit beta [Armatimonadota bacterium]
MKIPVAWLREYVEVPADKPGLEAFADALTMAGLEVEEILDTSVGPTFYTKVTPNRGDWASVYGTAREAAAIFPALTLKSAKPDGTRTPAPGDSSHPKGGSEAAPARTGTEVSVSVEDPKNCPRYGAKIIRGVKIGPTPDWMQQRLAAALGEKYKTVNNVVDITNYVMLELGQPLHAFDLDMLPGGQVVVRQARDGETLTTLDGTERKLGPGTLAICDAEKPIAIAGILGGGPTEITEGTVHVFLESAHFDALSIRRTSKRLNLATEASYRFERYVDPALVPLAADRAAQLIVEIAGGTAEPGLVEVRAAPTPPRRIVARVERIRKLLGADVDRDAMVKGLERLGLSVERSAGALDVVVPSWRPDLTIEDDIAEEVGRIALGYANLPETLPPMTSGGGRDSARGLFSTKVRETLVRAGLQDALTHSLVAPSPLATEEEAAHRVVIRSALSPELSSLRTSLIPNLLTIAARAHASGVRDIAVFEIGSVYRREDGGYREPLRITGVASGSAMPPEWGVGQDALMLDFYFAKGVVEDLLRALGIEEAHFVPGAHPITHPGRTATIRVDGDSIGVIAELSEATVEAEDLPRRTYLFDLDGDLLARLSGDAKAHYKPLPKYPALTRDLAPVFPDSVSYGAIEQAATEAAGPLLESLRLTDVYQGSNLGEGRKSLTLRLVFRSPSGTLKDAEVEATLTAIRAALTALGGELRG